MVAMVICYIHSQSNFAMGATSSTGHTCFMLDFGLSRQYTKSNGEVRPVCSIDGCFFSAYQLWLLNVTLRG